MNKMSLSRTGFYFINKQKLLFLLGDEPPRCTDEERWKKDDTFRVNEEG